LQLCDAGLQLTNHIPYLHPKTVSRCTRQLIAAFEATRLDIEHVHRVQQDECILSVLCECHILPSLRIPFNLTPIADAPDEMELPLHIACAVGCSFGVIQLIYKLFPPALCERSPSRNLGGVVSGVLRWSDVLPIHYACIYGASVMTISFLVQHYPKSRHCQASVGTGGSQRPFNLCFWRDEDLDWKSLLPIIGRHRSFASSLEPKGDLYFDTHLNVDRIERFIQMIQPDRKDISILPKTNYSVNHLGLTLDESLDVQDSLVMKLHPKDDDWGEILLALEAMDVPMRWMEIRTKDDDGTIPRLTSCVRRFVFKETLEQMIVDAVVDTEEEMDAFLETVLSELPNLKSLGLNPGMKWFGTLVQGLAESNCSLRHVVFGPEYPRLGAQADPVTKQQVEYYCKLNQLGRGIFKKESARIEDTMKVLDSCINESVSILYGMLRFHPAKWSGSVGL
jgi:hypothetical protein